MNALQFLLALFDSSGGKLQGRTLVQKKAYFASLLSGVDPGLDFNAHYYGPYSAVVDSAIAQLKNLGFVAEDSTGFGIYNEGFELRRYDYALTADGKKLAAALRGSHDYQRIASAVHKIGQAGDPSYFELSIAAKAYYILTKKNKPMANSEIRREAGKSFNWNIQPQSLEKAIAFLRQLDLTEDAGQERAV
jgi:uncharacterized protein YwgA